MHRIDTSTATPASMFTEGGPSSGVPATVVSAAWLNAVQEELCAVVAGAGLALAKPDNTQVAQAIAIIAAMAVPAGTVIATASQAVPPGYLACAGQAVPRSAYPALFSAIGVTYGAGDGSLTFNLPDLRGEFIRGADGGRGVDAGRAFGSSQLDALQQITGNLRVVHGGVAEASGAFAANGDTASHINTGVSGTDAGITFAASRVARTANETRPRNVALQFVIKT